MNTNTDDGRSLEDRDAIRSWADERGAVPVVAATDEGELSLRFSTDDDPQGRELDWEAFFSIYESSDASFVVDDDGDRQRFVDASRIPGTGDDDAVHPDADRRGTDEVDRETDQIEREAEEIQNPDNHRDEEPFQS